jgi:hypothetical protein
MRRIRRHLTYSNVMVTLLAFIVLTGGTAVALDGANTVFSDDIVNGEVKAADVAANAINGSKVADNQVSTLDVRNDTLSGGGLVAGDLRPDSVGATELANASVSLEKLSAVGSATANTDPTAAAPFLIKARAEATDVDVGSSDDVNIYTATRDFLIVDAWSICESPAPSTSAAWQLRDAASTAITNSQFNSCGGSGFVGRVQLIDTAARQIATGESLTARLTAGSATPVDFAFDIYVLALPVSL